MLKAIALTTLVPVALITVICAATVIGVNWNGGAEARFGSVFAGYRVWQLAV